MANASRELCPLHRTAKLSYTRNSSGYYSSYAPPCNGCDIGIKEEMENKLMIEIENLSLKLKNIWMNLIYESDLLEANNIADLLTVCIDKLTRSTDDVLSVVQIGKTALNIHNAGCRLYSKKSL
jgi:hypothetical protein